MELAPCGQGRVSRYRSFATAANTPSATTIMEPRRTVGSCLSRSSSAFTSCFVASLSEINFGVAERVA